MLVPDSLLPRANGMMQTTWSLSGIISPALAAFIIALPGLAAQGAIPFAPLVGLHSGTPATGPARITDDDRPLPLIEQPPPFPVRVAPGGRLDLAPSPTLAGAIWGIAALADHPLEASLLGRAQERQAVFEGFG
jgi:hypothetical protein